MAVISRGEAWPAAWHVEYSQVPSPWRALALRHATPRWADELAHRVHASARPGPDLRVWWPRTSLSLSLPRARAPSRPRAGAAAGVKRRKPCRRQPATTRRGLTRHAPPASHRDTLASRRERDAHRILLRARGDDDAVACATPPSATRSSSRPRQAGRRATWPSPLLSKGQGAAQQWWWTGGGRPPAPDHHSLSLKRSACLLPPSAFLRRSVLYKYFPDHAPSFFMSSAPQLTLPPSYLLLLRSSRPPLARARARARARPPRRSPRPAPGTTSKHNLLHAEASHLSSRPPPVRS